MEDGVTGLIVPPRNSEALAEAIMRFVRNPELVYEMKPKCRGAAENFSLDAYGRRLAELIDRRMNRFTPFEAKAQFLQTGFLESAN